MEGSLLIDVMCSTEDKRQSTNTMRDSGPDTVWRADYRDEDRGKQRNRSSITLLLFPLLIVVHTPIVPIYGSGDVCRHTSISVIQTCTHPLHSEPFHSTQSNPGPRRAGFREGQRFRSVHIFSLSIRARHIITNLIRSLL